MLESFSSHKHWISKGNKTHDSGMIHLFITKEAFLKSIAKDKGRKDEKKKIVSLKLRLDRTKPANKLNPFIHDVTRIDNFHSGNIEQVM